MKNQNWAGVLLVLFLGMATAPQSQAQTNRSAYGFVYTPPTSEWSAKVYNLQVISRPFIADLQVQDPVCGGNLRLGAQYYTGAISSRKWAVPVGVEIGFSRFSPSASCARFENRFGQERTAFAESRFYLGLVSDNIVLTDSWPRTRIIFGAGLAFLTTTPVNADPRRRVAPAPDLLYAKVYVDHSLAYSKDGMAITFASVRLSGYTEQTMRYSPKAHVEWAGPSFDDRSANLYSVETDFLLHGHGWYLSPSLNFATLRGGAGFRWAGQREGLFGQELWETTELRLKAGLEVWFTSHVVGYIEYTNRVAGSTSNGGSQTGRPWEIVPRQTWNFYLTIPLK